MSHDLQKNTPQALQKWEDKFDRVHRWYKDQTGTITLPADLDLERRQWAWIYGVIDSGKFAKDSQLVNAILKEYPALQARTAQRLLDDTRRFYAVLKEPNLAFERVMLINDLKEDMRRARKKGDFKSLGRFRSLYATVIGADKPVEPVENRTVINVLNYNPSNLGAQEIDEEKLNKMIKNLMAQDKKKQEQEFDDFTELDDDAA